jgi:hypothetical protein
MFRNPNQSTEKRVKHFTLKSNTNCHLAVTCFQTSEKIRAYFKAYFSLAYIKDKHCLSAEIRAHNDAAWGNQKAVETYNF